MNFRRNKPNKRAARRGSWWKLYANIRRDFRQSHGEAPLTHHDYHAPHRRKNVSPSDMESGD